MTYVGSTVGDLLGRGRGVCQDFAHLALLLLRRHGIGARYVSGYLWAPPEGDESAPPRSRPTPGSRRCCPARTGLTWVAADPTNRTLGGESHVKIGHGRHYADVPPIKGVYRGGAGLGAERLGADDPQALTAGGAGFYLLRAGSRFTRRHGPVALLRRHRGLGSDAQARPARAAAARGRRADPVRLRRGHPAPAAALIGLPDVDAIFITHLHLDHWLGLPGMIKTFDMRARERAAGASSARPA